MNFVHYFGYSEQFTGFEILDLFLSSCEKVGRSTLLGPLETAGSVTDIYSF